jgi:ubiquinone/menaquinone biosynthesis C-methylase UbiE
MALDLTRAMLAHAQAKAQTLNLSNLSIQQANARFLPFPDDTFDVVLSFRFFHLFSLEDQQILLAELHRVVKPGGKVVVEYNNAGALWVGGFLHNFFRIFSGRQALNRQPVDELQTLYKHFQVSHLQGFSWPFMGTVARLSSRLARSLLGLSKKDSLRKFARYVWVESGKPNSGEGTASA